VQAFDKQTDGQTDVDSKVRSNEVRCAQKRIIATVEAVYEQYAADVGQTAREMKSSEYSRYILRHNTSVKKIAKVATKVQLAI